MPKRKVTKRRGVKRVPRKPVRRAKPKPMPRREELDALEPPFETGPQENYEPVEPVKKGLFGG